jgi:hypothetical protein
LNPAADWHQEKMTELTKIKHDVLGLQQLHSW